MTTTFETIGLIGKPGDEAVAATLAILKRELSGRGCAGDVPSAKPRYHPAEPQDRRHTRGNGLVTHHPIYKRVRVGD